MKIFKWQILFIFIIACLMLMINQSLAGTTIKLSNIFTLDTRDLNPIPVDGWQTLTSLGNTYNEDLIIDNFGKVWCFYFDSGGANQPIYLKIFKPDAYLYKQKQTVGYSSSNTDIKYNSIRAALNDATGDIWVAIQGTSGGYFVIYDSTGTVKQDSTFLGSNSFLPKVSNDKNGKMWFTWHTDINNPAGSNGKIAGYNANGEEFQGPINVTSKTGIYNTDIAIDDSNHIWVVYEMNEGGDYSTRCSIFNNDLSLIVDGRISNNQGFLNTQRQIYSDKINQRMWILENNVSPSNQVLHIFGLDGIKINTIENVEECSFTRNEKNQFEVVRFNDDDILNKTYEYALFNSKNGELLSSWVTLFDSTFQFVKNGIAYNRNYNSLKAYLVNKEQNLTQIKFQEVTPGIPEIYVTPKMIKFDTTKIKDGYVKQDSVTIQNSGAEILVVSNITSLDVRFSAVDTSFQLLPGQSRNVIIQFTPDDTNQVSSKMYVLSNDPNNSSVEIIVSGKGYEPTTPKIVVSPGSLIFDTILIGNSQKKFIYINNIDTYEPLVISSITASDTQFTVNKSNFVINPKQGEWVEITFKPVNVGIIEGNLIIENNDPDSSNYVVPLVGEGREPGNPQIWIDRDTLKFGQVEIDKNKTSYFEVWNKGERTLSINNISSDNPQFVVDTTAFTVTANDSQLVHVKFTPIEEGLSDAQLTIYSNDEENSEAQISLQGVGVLLSDPQLVCDKTELSFGKVLVGDSLKRGIVFQNYGDRTLKLFNITTSDTNFIVREDTVKIEKLESFNLILTFLPADTLNYSGVLQVHSNDPKHEIVEINLFGKGEKKYQRISVFPTNLPFDDTQINSTSYKSVIISNVGIEDLNILNIISNNDNFTPAQTNFNLTEGQSRDVQIAFKPDSVKRFNGRITIVSDDPVVDSLIVTTTGVGRDSINQIISVSPDTLDFGDIARQNKSTPLIITIHNKGEKTLSILNVEATSSAFIFNKNNFQVLGSTSESIYVYFSPQENRNYADTLKIICNDPENDTVFVFLKGIGRDPYSQKIEVSSHSLEFGIVPIERSKGMSLWINNVGEMDLAVNKIEVTDSHFKVSENWFILEPNQKKNVIVTFLPNSEESVSANLNIFSNDPNPDSSEIVIRLTGMGALYTGPQISIMPETIDFGNTLLGAKKIKAFWVYNLSTESTLEITNYSLNNELFAVTNEILQIPAGGKGSIAVTYQPRDKGYHTATLTIYSNDTYNNEYTTWLYGYGVTENVGQNTFSYWGWNGFSSAPFGEAYAPGNRTQDVLKNANERAWFIKDIYLYESPNPDSAYINLSFKNNITLIINNTLVFDSTATNAVHWNKEGLNIYDFLNFGRNRIAVVVGSSNNTNGGFDCELVINGETKIKRGDENWNNENALWWYYYSSGNGTVPTDTLQNRMWFAKDYALTGIDTVTANWFFEPTGNDTLFDSTPYGHRAILHNITWVKGIVGEAMQFNGTNSYVELNTNLNRIPQIIEMWINCYGAQHNRQNLITNLGDGQYSQGVFIEPDLSLGVYYYNGEYIIPNYHLEPNTWCNLSIQYDYNHSNNSNIINIYVNNEFVGSTTFSPIYPSSSASTCYLGGNPLNPISSAFYGAIDELKIKNTVSSTPQIPQIATIAKISSDTVAVNDSAIISFDIYPSPFKVLSGIFKYYPGGSSETGTDFRADTIEPSVIDKVSPISFTIPKENIDIRGVHYSLTLQTNYGTVHYPEIEQNEYGYDYLQIRTEGENSQTLLRDKIYRMISVPYELADKSVDAVLFDDFGLYNPFHWRLFDWSQSNPDTQYVEFDTTAIWGANRKFDRGKSYWVITDGLSIFDAGNGMSPPDSVFRIALHPGWNMIGNPFPFPVNWSNVHKTSIDKISDLYYRSTIDVIAWRYGPETLDPWEGYFILNADSVNQFLIVPPSGDYDIPLKKTVTLADKYRSKFRDLTILISADVRCGKYEDSDNLFGAAKKASNEYDKYDLLEAPVIGDYVSLWINNKNWSKNNVAYTVDIRKDGEDGYSWNLLIDYSLSNPKDILTLKLDNLIKIPDNWQMYLFDLSDDVAINLKEKKFITFNSVKGKGVRKSFNLVIGTDEFIQINSDEIPLVPMKFDLSQNYPNPFNSSTTIIFSLPKRMHLTLKIYNILGQLVKTLVDNEIRGGIHKLIWNGKNDQDVLLSSGMYFVRIEGKKQVIVKKMLLIK